MTDYGGPEWVDWCDVTAVGVVARDRLYGDVTWLFGELLANRPDVLWSDVVEQTASGIRYGAREIERLEERVREMRDEIEAALSWAHTYDTASEFAEEIGRILAADDRLRRRRD